MANAWEGVSGGAYDAVAAECVALKKALGLNDWGYYDLARTLADGFCGPKTNESVVLQSFLMAEAGYKVRLARGDGRLFLLLATDGQVHARPYFNINGQVFYILDDVPRAASYNICNFTIPGERPLSLAMPAPPLFAQKPAAPAVRNFGGVVSTTVTVNRNLMDFYTNYPPCYWSVYVATALTVPVRGQLYPPLRVAVAGKGEREAAELLLHYLHRAFPYKTDEAQFGVERTFFAEEMYYYPYSDCEDRSILFARLVVCPEESVKAYEEELTDDYWQRFWGFLGYSNTGAPKGGAAVDRLRSVFGQREDDIRLAEAVYYLARGFDAFETSMLERAGELASSVRREYLSKPLIPVYDTLQRLVRENIRLEEKYTPMETFVLVDVFRAGKYIEYLCAEQARKEQAAREAEARREQEAREAEAKQERERRAAEQALRRKQAELSADRSKRMEEEIARLGCAKPAATQQADWKSFAGYETVVPGTKKRNWGKTILIVVVCLIALIGLLFLIPVPESLQ